MKMEAGVLWGVGEEWSVEEVELEGPQAGEVLVRYTASGLCHSDDHFRTGDMIGRVPTVGGHEGAGIVEEVGPGVTGLKAGDHVVATFLPSCGQCRWCASGYSNLCDRGALITEGCMPDHTFRRRARGEELGGMAGIGTFAPYGTVSEHALTKIDEDLPLDLASLVGCGVTTGWGSAVNTADVTPGDTVVVVGVGGIGSAAIQGARIAGAEKIVAVDLVAGKKQKAELFGATHFVTSLDEATELVRELTRGVMADAVILTPGIVKGEMIAQALAATRKAGTTVVAGIAPMRDMSATISLADLTLSQKSIKGSLFGEANARADIPRLLSLYREGKLLLEEMVTTEYKLVEVNQGYADMLAGRNIRGLIRHQH